MIISYHFIYAPDYPYMYAIYNVRRRALYVNSGTNRGSVIKLLF